MIQPNFFFTGKSPVPNFTLNDEDHKFLALSLDANHDHSKPISGEREWHLKRFGWDRWPDAKTQS